MRFRSSRESRRLLVSQVDPLDFALHPNGIGDPVQGIPGNAIDSLHSRLRECFHHQFRNILRHNAAPLVSFGLGLEPFRILLRTCVDNIYLPPGAATYGLTIRAGSTTRSNTSSVTKPSFSAAAFSVRSWSRA